MINLDQVKQSLQENDLEIESEKILQNGVQLRIRNCGCLRIYWRKDGRMTIDLSQIKLSCLPQLNDILTRADPEKINLSAENDLEIQRRILNHLPDDPTMILPAIGSDEAGKGDLFGPLVVAAVYVGKTEYGHLGKYQLKDSKLLSTKRVLCLADQIKSVCEYSLAVVEPKDFTGVENMNSLLEDLHARCINEVLGRKGSLIAIYDDFGAKNLKERLKNHSDLTVLGFKKAERNLAVAAASIVARGEFLSWIDRASSHYGKRIPLGAGQKAIEFAKDFLRDYGLKELEKIAKMNFSSLQDLISMKSG